MSRVIHTRNGLPISDTSPLPVEGVGEGGGGGGGDGVDEQRVRDIAGDIAEEEVGKHEERTIFKDRVHGLAIIGDILEYWDHERDEWVELYASEFQTLPRVRNLVAEADGTGESITVTFENPLSPTYLRTEVYISDQDITSMDRDDVEAVADRIINDNETTSYTHET